MPDSGSGDPGSNPGGAIYYFFAQKAFKLIYYINIHKQQI
jgi:hypothetical protein